MIYIGYPKDKKSEIVNAYIKENGIEKVVVLGPAMFSFQCMYENVDYPNLIKYVFYYRLLSYIDTNTLVVVNECLQNKKRYDLTFNCVRNFLNQTNHQIIFQYLPIIETREELMTVIDFDTKSQWRRMSFNALVDSGFDFSKHITIHESFKYPEIIPLLVETSKETKAKYEEEKARLFSDLGQKDPHTLPRNLHLVGWRDKKKHAEQLDYTFLVRNDRAKIKNAQTYGEEEYQGTYCMFDIPHDFIELVNFFALSEQQQITVLLNEIKVDTFYYERIKKWLNEINYVCTKISQRDMSGGDQEKIEVYL